VSSLTRSRRTRTNLRLDRTLVPGQTVGLLAGSGRFPILFAESARRQGYKVACVGIRYEASEELRDLCSSFQIVGVSRLGGMIRAFKRAEVREIVMAARSPRV